jgi:hypothetical protein
MMKEKEEGTLMSCQFVVIPITLTLAAMTAQLAQQRAMGWMDRVRFPAGARDSSPQHADHLWSPPSLLLDEYQEFYHQG